LKNNIDFYLRDFNDIALSISSSFYTFHNVVIKFIDIDKPETQSKDMTVTFSSILHHLRIFHVISWNSCVNTCLSGMRILKKILVRRLNNLRYVWATFSLPKSLLLPDVWFDFWLVLYHLMNSLSTQCSFNSMRIPSSISITKRS
jgi:hypothetical protein